MSQTIRTFGAGLLASAWLAQHYQMTYLHALGRTSLNYAFELAIRSMGSGPAQVLGIGGYLLAIYLLLCLGAGMLLAGFLYPLLELLALGALRLPASLWRMFVILSEDPRVASGGGPTEQHSKASPYGKTLDHPTHQRNSHE